MSDVMDKIRKLEEEEKALKKKKKELLKKHQEELEKQNCKKVNISSLQNFIGKDIRVTSNDQEYDFSVKKLEIKSIELDFGDFSYAAKDVNEFKKLLTKWAKDFGTKKEEIKDDFITPSATGSIL
jgi:hypothetical protein